MDHLPFKYTDSQWNPLDAGRVYDVYPMRPTDAGELVIFVGYHENGRPAFIDANAYTCGRTIYRDGEHVRVDSIVLPVAAKRSDDRLVLLRTDTYLPGAVTEYRAMAPTEIAVVA